MTRKIIKINAKIIKNVRVNVAAYARVSTDKINQLDSLMSQKQYYTKFIKSNPDWNFVGLFTDEGISGTTTKKREGFNRMIKKAMSGEIDYIITKSISRFARNTVDTISILRKLKNIGVSVYFEKENIDSGDNKGEFMLTIMSSFAQEESRSISENIKWGKRKSFEEGKVTLGYSRFLGYDKGENGNLVINTKQAKIVKAIYCLRAIDYTYSEIAKELEKNMILTPSNNKKWRHSTIKRILHNEKYKGDALLQKTFTMDFITKKVKVNEGELPKYYIKNNHEAIISRKLHDSVSTKKDLDRFNKNERLSGKIKCLECGSYYTRFIIHPESDGGKLAWRCRNKYNKKNKCNTMHVYDSELMNSLLCATIKLIRRRKDIINQTFFDIEKISYRLINKDNISNIIKMCEIDKNHMSNVEFLDGTKYNSIQIKGTRKKYKPPRIK